MELTRGARFYKCALQVNPFDYLKRNKKATTFTSEDDYNRAVIAACLKEGIEAIAITDHFRVATAKALQAHAQAAGIVVFGGFEAVSKDGFHLLCLFNPRTPAETLERIIGALGVTDRSAVSPLSTLDCEALAKQCVERWNGICIAAHVATKGGILETPLRGQPTVAAWTAPYILACSVSTPTTALQQSVLDIVRNTNPEYRRPRAIAVINALDVFGPADVSNPLASSLIKMSAASVEGLRQAFYDPGSRIRLNSDPPPPDHVQLVAIAWEGGFLDGTKIHFNESLNVLIGGRGAGKSTVIESIRHVLGLQPIAEDALKSAQGIIKSVLQPGTKISLLMRSPRPKPSSYVIERTIPNPAVVRDANGQTVDLSPQDIVGGTEVYGQHEIAELSKSKERLTRLLIRFVESDPNLPSELKESREALEKSRTDILQLRKRHRQNLERLEILPSLDATLKRYNEAGLEERLKDQSALVSEEGLLKRAESSSGPVRKTLNALEKIEIDSGFLSKDLLSALPRGDILGTAEPVVKRLGSDVKSVVASLAAALERFDDGLKTVTTNWEAQKEQVMLEYNRILRELQESKVDAEAFLLLRQQMETLRPIRDAQPALDLELSGLESSRRTLVANWEDLKRREFRRLENAAQRVSRQLQGKVLVRVTYSGDCGPLVELIRNELSGRTSELTKAIESKVDLSLPELVEACKKGAADIANLLSVPLAQAEKLASASEDLYLQMQECYLPHATDIQLNVATEGAPAIWKGLADLSTGQKATAVLLLLLLESPAPLVIDQPEDDLDNRFIAEQVVPKMRDEKMRRQFIFSTHNANIPVLGDAELIIGLAATGEAGGGHSQILPTNVGSIDTDSVRELTEEILEGGREAFEMRRLKYGF